MAVVDVVLLVHDHLAGQGVAHAFGGALALGYYAEPRGTIDVDLNVFVPPEDIGLIVESLGALGFRPLDETEAWMPAAGIRLSQPGEPAPLDLFPSLDGRYEVIATRVRRHPFGPGRRKIPFLSAEDVVLFKLSFGREKDWVDIRRVVEARPALDVEYIEGQLIGLRGESMYPRLARLRQMLRSQL